MHNRTALVIGGATGIGRSIAMQLVADGHTVIVADIDEKVSHTYANYPQVSIYILDVSNALAVEHFCEEIQQNITTLHVIVYTVGITKKLDFQDVGYALWQKTFAINLSGVFYCMKYLDPIIKNSRGISIILIGSGSSLTGSGGGVQYYSSKGGMIGMMRYFVHAYESIHAKVNVIAPRVIQSQILDHLYPTEQARESLLNKIPVGRIGTGNDIATLVQYLCSDAGSYINGQVLLLDGGRTYSSKKHD
ncbi:MAG: SDR family oxidoreductase [Solibacillus sp.]